MDRDATCLAPKLCPSEEDTRPLACHTLCCNGELPSGPASDASLGSASDYGAGSASDAAPGPALVHEMEAASGAGPGPEIASELVPIPSEKQMWEAAASGDHQTIKLLLAAHVDPNAADEEGNTALHHAALHCESECVEVLLSAGAGVYRELHRVLIAIAPYGGTLARWASFFTCAPPVAF